MQYMYTIMRKIYIVTSIFLYVCVCVCVKNATMTYHDFNKTSNCPKIIKYFIFVFSKHVFLYIYIYIYIT